MQKLKLFPNTRDDNNSAAQFEIDAIHGTFYSHESGFFTLFCLLQGHTVQRCYSP